MKKNLPDLKIPHFFFAAGILKKFSAHVSGLADGSVSSHW